MKTRAAVWLVLALAVLFFAGCYQTYDRYTGYSKYYPDFNVDYANDMEPPVDAAPASGAPRTP
ncbi:MAG: hypothetical protein HY720_20455 [Planctomycetes bacterium]|nr:hypothetical protein [Planctomycetota bacterium]